MSAGLDGPSHVAALDRFLIALEARLRDEIGSTPVTYPARALLHAGGKRLRARLLWWSAIAMAPRALRQRDVDTLVQAAAAIELAHLSSLIHDDIVDAAETRRGVPSLHRSDGVRIATDTGAALAHLASTLVAPLGSHARQAVRRAILAMCRGQVRELAAPFVALSPRARLAIMQEKTAAFFELAATLGVRLVGGAVIHRAAARRFARRWGVAFQIADDVLDLAGDPQELGRPNGADLRDGVLTLPVLLATDRDGGLAQALHQVQRSSEPEAVATCVALIERGDGIARAAAIAAWWLEHAKTALAVLPATPARQALADLAAASVRRGLTRGTPLFAAPATARPSVASRFSDAAAEATSLTMLSRDPGAAGRLAQSLDWIQPGLSTTVIAQAGEVAATPERFEGTLLRSDTWSSGARVAARAIALAHALAHDRALRTYPVRTLALADCLHSIGIALLCDGTDAAEHERMAQRAQALSTLGFMSTARGAVPQPTLSLTA